MGVALTQTQGGRVALSNRCEALGGLDVSALADIRCRPKLGGYTSLCLNRDPASWRNRLVMFLVPTVSITGLDYSLEQWFSHSLYCVPPQ